MEPDRTQRNPYSPPATTELEPTSSEVAHRPLAMWLLLIVLFAMMLIWIAGMPPFFRLVAQHGTDVRNPLLLAVVFAGLLGFVAVMLLAIVSIYRRWHWGRWLGIATIVALIIWNFLRHDDSRYPDEWQRLGALTGRFVILPLLFAWWAYAFGFSSKAKRYFTPP
jgi:hypothetical protein